LRIALDDNFRAGADVRHECGEVAGCFGFRDVDGGQDSDDSANLALQRAREDAGDYVVFVGFGDFGFVEAAGF
jgi:hypothetical protein